MWCNLVEIMYSQNCLPRLYCWNYFMSFIFQRLIVGHWIALNSRLELASKLSLLLAHKNARPCVHTHMNRHDAKKLHYLHEREPQLHFDTCVMFNPFHFTRIAHKTDHTKHFAHMSETRGISRIQASHLRTVLASEWQAAPLPFQQDVTGFLRGSNARPLHWFEPCHCHCIPTALLSIIAKITTHWDDYSSQS